MKTMKKAKKAFHAAVSAAAVLLASFFLCRPIELCLCDKDPDGCGEECHDCSSEHCGECDHVTVDSVDSTTVTSKVSLPEVIYGQPASPSPAATADETLPAAIPPSTAPPWPPSEYMHSKAILYPLS